MTATRKFGYRNHIYTCAGPDFPATPGTSPALVWLADPGAPPVTSVSEALPTCWRMLGLAEIRDDSLRVVPETLRLAFYEFNRGAVQGLRVGDRCALVLDTTPGLDHVRLWLPSVRLVDADWTFAVYPDADGVTAHRFAGSAV